MTRELVLTNEAARHPFRQRLPRPRPVALEAPPRRTDLQLFAGTFTAGFVAFYGILL